ncbi:hypothetical protein KY334_02235 [Candidatus Woesearchaeota archaeon]|nr:hypothetical protein [Candidatus Woesearchaeota archaeon]
MIIYKPRIKEIDSKICITAEIELKKQIPGIPKTLWYEVPKKYKKYISKNSDCFLVAMIHLAMYLKEDIEIKGSISQKLFYSIKEYQAIYNSWVPKIFKKIIKIKCNDLKKSIGKGKKGVTCSFSGGVDSTYTFYKHLPKYESNKDYQLNSVLFIHDYLFSPKEKENYDVAKEKFENIVKEHKLNFIPIRTNASYFRVERFPEWVELTFGSYLISCVLVLSNSISKFYVSSSYDYSNLGPCGVHPMSDYLLSTESLDIVHDGAGVSRLKKIRFISKIPETYSFLRTCWKIKNKFVNCGACEKCIRTMVSLSLFNRLHLYTTYPSKLKRKLIRKTYLTKYNICFAKENIRFAKKINKRKISFDLKYAIFRSKFIVPILKEMWKHSASLKKKSKLYTKFVRIVKNDNS